MWQEQHLHPMSCRAGSIWPISTWLSSRMCEPNTIPPQTPVSGAHIKFSELSHRKPVSQEGLRGKAVLPSSLQVGLRYSLPAPFKELYLRCSPLNTRAHFYRITSPTGPKVMGLVTEHFLCAFPCSLCHAYLSVRPVTEGPQARRRQIECSCRLGAHQQLFLYS